MIKYFFCFFMCLLSVNGADEDEAEEAESFYESRIVCGSIRELPSFNDLFSYDSFWEPEGFLPYQQFSHVKLPKLPLLNPATLIKPSYPY